MLEIKIREIQDKFEVENKKHKLEKNEINNNFNYNIQNV